MAKAYHIDSANYTISEVEYSNSEQMRKFIGGWIECASFDPVTGDVLYVDEEGLLKGNKNFFAYAKRPDQWLAGNGLYVGREVDDDSDQGYYTLDPVKTLEQLKHEVIFMKVK